MISIVKMTADHLESVHAIEESSFSVPWTRDSLKRELETNENAHYFVAVDGTGGVIGYCGMWRIVNEGHVTNIAVLPEHRKKGVATALVTRLIEAARSLGIIAVTLEVRFNNAAAHKLYSKFGFVTEGIRKNYYSDTKEDALIMWKYL